MYIVLAKCNIFSAFGSHWSDAREEEEENKLRSAGVERGSARPSFARMSMVAGALMSEYLNAHESPRSGAYDPVRGGRVGIRKL